MLRLAIGLSVWISRRNAYVPYSAATSVLPAITVNVLPPSVTERIT